MRARRTAAAAALALLLAGCSSSGDDATAPSTTSSPSTSPSGSVPPTTTSPPATTRSPLAVPATEVAGTTVLAKDLDVPWGLARLDDGSHLVSLRDQARIVRVATDGKVTRVPATGPDGRVPGVQPNGEAGLLGIAFAPADQSVLYAYLTAADDNRVVAMRYSGGRLGAPTPLVTGIPKADHHDGGRLAFGPDGMLYVTTGDGGVTSRAQDRGDLGGKILRVTRTGAPAPGNPFPGSRVWSYGHRNVQGLGWDSAGRMFASEFGQNTWDELNRILPGRNYGWPDVEGMGTAADVRHGFTQPLAVWPTDEASPSGLAVGRGAVWLAALRGERLWRVPLRADGSTGRPQSLLRNEFGRLRTAAFEPDGSMLVFTNNTFRGDPGADDDRLLRLTLR